MSGGLSEFVKNGDVCHKAFVLVVRNEFLFGMVLLQSFLLGAIQKTKEVFLCPRYPLPFPTYR